MLKFALKFNYHKLMFALRVSYNIRSHIIQKYMLVVKMFANNKYYQIFKNVWRNLIFIFTNCSCSYRVFDSVSKCFMKFSLAVWWSKIVILRVWNECKTAKLTSTRALSFHKEEVVCVSSFILFATVWRVSRFKNK